MDYFNVSFICFLELQRSGHHSLGPTELKYSSKNLCVLQKKVSHTLVGWHEGSHDRAVLLYEYVGKKTVDLQHTEVPEAYRGREIAKHLAKAAMDFVVEEDLKAHLTCWYIQKYIKENPHPHYLEHIIH
ncbi:protein NATD1 isoform X2 [Myxocyprinus asiaticus]|uniref:protein NATD1 isoform X2 n=1 Tax=Myxocyprinus asiaticus TaxID=70543 RepID=UPI0022231E21|nr:protein NATD1 isoform X2 [Myxocyprinus asiaticus]